MRKLHDLAKQYGKELEPRHREFVTGTTRGMMQRELSDLQSQQHGTRELMNLGRIGVFLETMYSFEEALVAIHTEEPSKIMAYVWGPVRLLIKITRETEKAFDNLLEGYEKLGAHMPHVSRYNGLFERIPETEELLVRIYEDVWKYHSMAYKLFSLRKKLWQRLHRPLWKDHATTLDQITKSLDFHSRFLANHASSFQAPIFRTDSGLDMDDPVDLQQIVGSFRRHINDLNVDWATFRETETERRNELKRLVKGWISSSQKNESMHHEFRKIRHKDNRARWLFRNKSYDQILDWMKVDEHPESALWLQGVKGFGKTILTSLIIDEVDALRKKEKKFTTLAKAKMCYFYCQEDDEEHRTYLDILRGILHQMVDQDDYIVPYCAEKVGHVGNNRLANAEIAEGLIETFVDYSPRQYIIIDGLDECANTEIRLTSQFFMGQIERCDNDNDLNNQGHLRVLFMSQSMPELEAYMPQGDAKIVLRIEDNAESIRAFVEKRLEEFNQTNENHESFNLSPADLQQITSIICSRSKGMFLYAYLALEYLLDLPTKGHLLYEIQQEILPDELRDLYNKILRSIKKRLLTSSAGRIYWKQAKQLLGWIVCAKRSLKWHELQAIVSFNAESRTFDFDNKMLRDNTRKYLGSLVNILDGGYIRLIHTTARGCILDGILIEGETTVQRQRANGSSMPKGEKAIQCQMATLCLQYLSLPCFVKDHELSERQENARMGWFAFQDYACAQWHRHIDTIIRECHDAFTEYERDPSIEAEFTVALDLFINAHGNELEKDEHQDLDRTYITKFQSSPVYENLLRLWNHIFKHQKGDYDARNKVGITQIDEALLENRKALEEFSPLTKTINSDTMEAYYGAYFFKCPKTLCRFFHAGYDSAKERDSHGNRHDRPYPCPKPGGCNSAPIGFSTNKDKDRHVRIYHPELSEGPSVFEPLTARQEPGRFTCPICGSCFTRKINLKGHERTHYGDRPYACSMCGKAFTRINDCRRHERTACQQRRIG